MHAYIREPFNSLSHLVGAVLSVIALIAMTVKASISDVPVLHIVAVIIFGISMVLLYTASATYHMVIAKDNVIAFFRRLDHSMIFLLIAGSYAPFCLIALNGKNGFVLFSVVTGLAIAGILFKMVWFNCPRWLSTALYIGMGWIIVFLASPLTATLSAKGLWLLVVGGIMYTIGGVIYGAKPSFMKSKYLGFHEIFHIFILLGTLCHFLCVYMYVL
ncbi:hemolysin III family channel protein [Paenisporosarcina sp. HGH0030]|uniref:PAQR family membrane homeostasis protein TrhA n=1 Tax=Paenisporosarcina sp. HGH0030 TaxID=1078085 RepID=UPI00034E2177|nr:hemolysin III family protein [Paenisporosarcina sp. HGH0030]EPD51395.1 hemolysin III family channel protein [Paenisporosarcina sp. HGH0030]